MCLCGVWDTHHSKVGTKWWIKDAWQIKRTKKNSNEPLSKTHYIINDHSPAAFLNIETHPHLSRRDSSWPQWLISNFIPGKKQNFSNYFSDEKPKSWSENHKKLKKCRILQKYVFTNAISASYRTFWFKFWISIGRKFGHFHLKKSFKKWSFLVIKFEINQ